MRYASEFDEYGFGNVGILLQAEEQDLIECFDELKVKKPHRRLLLKAWEGLAKFGEQHRQRKVRVAEEPPQTPEATKKVEADPKPAKSDRKAAKEAAKAAKTAAKAKATKMTPSAALAVDLLASLLAAEAASTRRILSRTRFLTCCEKLSLLAYPAAKKTA